MNFAYRRSEPFRPDGSGDGAVIFGESIPIGPEVGAYSGGDRNTILAPGNDPVTGLLSYHGFVTAMDRAAQTSAPYAIVFLDIADFRLLNDVHGVAFGDEVLCAVARVLMASGVASGELIGRIGPDEFAVLLPTANTKQATARVERIQEAMAQLSLIAPNGDRLPVGAHIAAAAYPEDASTPAALRRVAEARAGQRLPISLLEDAGALYSEMERTVIGFHLLDALVSAVDAQDAYTRRHSEDVLRHVVLIAREMGLPLADQHALMVAALVHDIGKIALPERILRRPDTLLPDEVEALKEHPSIGATLLYTLSASSDHPEEMEKTRMAVRYHHERWDGKGYPSGLCGECIPLVARVLAVADAYSAMTLDRPYRKALSPQEAACRLSAGAGIQWDAACVTALFRSIPSLTPCSPLG